MSNIVIDIAAQFTGKPAFKKADTAVSQLNKGTQNLGKTLLAHSAQLPFWLLAALLLRLLQKITKLRPH